MAVVGERVESEVDVLVGAQILGARTIFGEGQTLRLDAVRRKARQQSLAVTARRRQELEPRLGNRAHDAAPQSERAIGELARIVEAAERHVPFLEAGQLVDLDILVLRLAAPRVVAPEGVGEPQRALTVVSIEIFRIEPWI